ncbi:MAG: RHS repeat-associated core domain-containing protein [Acutalibacteraceae bacterium]
MTWTMGRQLASFDGTTYTYDENGIRTSKTSNGETTEFYLNGTNVIYQTDGENDIYFFYDRNNELVGFKYSGNNYFYVKNAMGDITDIADSSGAVVASYSYDPWGKVTSVSGSNLAIANLNPFRYRSYYYDDDIGMYYLQSRYYDPEVGRFINCDDVNYIGYAETINSYNAFAYCENDPVNYSDLYGNRRKSYTPTYLIWVNIFYSNKNKALHADVEIDNFIYAYGNYARDGRPTYADDGKKKQGRLLTASYKNWINYNINLYSYYNTYAIEVSKAEYERLSNFILDALNNTVIEQFGKIWVYKFTKGKYKNYYYYKVNCATFVRDLLNYGLGKRFSKQSKLPLSLILSPSQVEKMVRKIAALSMTRVEMRYKK